MRRTVFLAAALLMGASAVSAQTHGTAVVSGHGATQPGSSGLSGIGSGSGGGPIQPETPGLAGIGAATASPPRPEADVARDADRKPRAMIALARIKPGAVVADLIPGQGYFTRVFADAVGPRGTVYALVPAAFAKVFPAALTGMQTAFAKPGYENVKVITWSPTAQPPVPVDVVWTAQNYHDLHNPPPGSPPGTPGSSAVADGINKAVFAMLKPGGLYVVLDHAAEAGSGARDTNTLHRIDPATVRAEVTAAGFTFDGESTAVRNPADPHTKNVFDPSIRGKTDQFVYRFRKPAT